MGLAASQSRMMMLMQRKSDIQFEVQSINQRRLTLANAASNVTRAMADNVYQTGDWTQYGPNPGSTQGYALPGIEAIYAPGGTAAGVDINGDGTPEPYYQEVTTSPIATGSYETTLTAIHAQDKELELRQKQLETEYKCMESEVDAVQKVIDKSIEKGFKTLG